jgi:hypothetical protein
MLPVGFEPTISAGERPQACLMLTDISSQTIFRAVCFISVSLTQNKWQGNLGYKMKNKAADLSRIGVNLI